MLRIVELQLISRTSSQTFGAKIPFYPGLNVVMAPNSAGKSTCLQAIVYALGLERMLGARLEIPLPYAMREKIHAVPKTTYEAVVESYVELIIENSKASVKVRRDVVGGADKKLVRTELLSGIFADFEINTARDYFLYDKGSARGEAGFHRFLADFVGWQLPMVPQFDGGEVPLYVETIFPMMFVEQKRGWSVIQGPLPTMFSIQDLNRRVIEFILDLQVGQIRRRGAELRATIAQLNQRWKSLRNEASEIAGPSMRVTTLSEEPTQSFVESPIVQVDAFFEQEWISLDMMLEKTRNELYVLEKLEVPQTEQISSEMESQLLEARENLEEMTSNIEVLRSEWLGANDDIKAIEQRLASLRLDLTRNQDALKLRSLGSVLGFASTDHKCPTCHQELEAELLPTVPVRAMAVEQNINFIKSQIELYGASLVASRERQVAIDQKYSALQDAVVENRQRVRELRQALLKPSSSPSRTIIERIVRLQARINRLVRIREKINEMADEAQSVAGQLIKARAELAALKSDRLSSGDKEKLDVFLSLVQRLCEEFGLDTFIPGEIKLSEDNFRPIREVEEDGEVRLKELGFDLSASDGIRLKWAYYLALMRIAKEPYGQHLGLVIFDEPGQQAMKLESLKAFFKIAAMIARKSQVITAITTEKAEGFIGELLKEGATICVFDGLVLQPTNAEL